MSAHFPRMQQLIASEFRKHVDDIKQDTTLQSLKLDSIDRVTLAVAVEDAFNITIPGDREERWSDVDSICQMLDALVPA